MKVIDFSNCHITNKGYGGNNGHKKCIIYNNNHYMLKFPAHTNKNHNIKYTNGIFCEYIGCNIFKLLGFNTQNVLLGKYTINDIERYCVACEDFTFGDYELQEFAYIKNQNIDSESKGYGTELVDILDTINKQNYIDNNELLSFFWNMFIVDCFIGNLDRHNGNWGFLYNKYNNDLKLAPIYDCGSCLYPQIDVNIINETMSNKEALEARIYEFPFSALHINGKSINYFDFINSLKYDGCNKAVINIVPKIDLITINRIIDDIEILPDIYKDFYKFILKKRKEMILDVSYNKIIQNK